MELSPEIKEYMKENGIKVRQDYVLRFLEKKMPSSLEEALAMIGEKYGKKKLSVCKDGDGEKRSCDQVDHETAGDKAEVQLGESQDGKSDDDQCAEELGSRKSVGISEKLRVSVLDGGSNPICHPITGKPM